METPSPGLGQVAGVSAAPFAGSHCDWLMWLLLAAQLPGILVFSPCSEKQKSAGFQAVKVNVTQLLCVEKLAGSSESPLR